MSFTDVEFFFFLPAVWLAYWLMPRKASAQNATLLIASYLFYASWSVRLLLLLVLSTGVDYLTTTFMDRPVPGDMDPAAARGRRVALGISVCCNLGALAYFKYSGFFAESLNNALQAFGLPADLPSLRVVLPLGISFYTLQKLGYVIDVYTRRIPVVRSPLDFATFVAFFPQITAGPISRGGELLPQLQQPRVPAAGQFASGAATFFLGFVLKALAADTLGRVLVDPIFSASADFGTLAHWLGLVAYAGQIFSDFAGYSLLAIGCARFFGIDLPINFNFPFFSTGLSEFWRRWHITLNQWLFDYIYVPLTTGTGYFRGRFTACLLLVFLASGLWHGAQWTFIAWGLLHGVGMAIQQRWDTYYRGLCRTDRVWVRRRQGWMYLAASWMLTQSYFLFVLILFRAESLGHAGRFAAGLVGAGRGTMRIPDLGGLVARMNLCLVFVFLVGYHLSGLQVFRGWRNGFFTLPAPVRGVVYGLVLVYLVIFVQVGPSAFIYRQF